MSTAISRVDHAPIESSATAIIQVIERAASNPEVDIDKMERLLQMQERVLARDAEAAFNADLAQMQNELPVIEENGAIKGRDGKVQSRYAKFEDINEAVKPILRQYGFAISFRTAFEGGEVIVTGVLSHRQGHREQSTVKLPADASGNKNNVQGWGSSISYGKRYTMSALLNITSRGEDNDGRGSGTGDPSGKPATQAPRSTGGGGALATEAQINLIRGKVERAGIDPNDFLARFELGELAELQFDDVNDALAWIKDNAR
jgi:hypothetical protein